MARAPSVSAGTAVCDVALLGTGLAPLLAAAYLVTQGKSVLVLNPQRDFFLENSELPVDPLDRLSVEAIAAAQPERALETLRPHFPGAVEFWPGTQKGAQKESGFRDEQAPHIRQRGRLLLGGGPDAPLDDLYLEASEAGMNPQLWEGVQALKRLPGSSAKAVAMEDLKGLYLPRSCDFDVTRYRNGVLEFVRERVPAENLVNDVSQVELLAGGARFHTPGGPRSAQFSRGMIVFWTPALTQWVLAQAKELEARPVAPAGARLWEQWSLLSREGLDASIIAQLDGLAIWAEAEGAPGGALDRLSLLRRGPLVPVDRFQAPTLGESWASEESFQDLSRLCSDYLGWHELSIRQLTARALLEWDLEDGERRPRSWKLDPLRRKGAPRAEGAEIPPVLVQGGCDGPLVGVVETARAACEELLELDLEPGTGGGRE